MANEEARQFCQERHGDLVSINSEDENIFLLNHVRYDSHIASTQQLNVV